MILIGHARLPVSPKRFAGNINFAANEAIAMIAILCNVARHTGVGVEVKMESRMVSNRASLGLGAAILALVSVSACSQKPAEDTGAAAPTETATATADNTTAAATPAKAEKPAADNTDTLDGTKFASFTGTAAAGEKVFAACKTCHAVEPGKNMVGPSLHAIQGRTAGTIPGYTYSTANKTSGITWTNEKLFQYLENPQRVIPGTKMTYTGVKDAQKRADLIAYLDTLK
jgi:cytochrome c